MPSSKTPSDRSGLDAVVAEAQRNRVRREQGYREQALKMYPWVCGRCGREFDAGNVRELTVHHRDHDHDNNPPDGSNWELLCVYCHDNEHQRQATASGAVMETSASQNPSSMHRPLGKLRDLLDKKTDPGE